MFTKEFPMKRAVYREMTVYHMTIQRFSDIKALDKLLDREGAMHALDLDFRVK